MRTTPGHAVAIAKIAPLFALVAILATGCSSSHGRDDDAGSGVRCGPTTCAAGLVCCNESCGICTEPGGGCIDLFCADAGTSMCGETTCAPGQTCCAGCPGSADFCVSGAACPLLDCPPPPPGCESCGIGSRCCPGCRPGEEFCVGGVSCPELVCPPPPECFDSSDCAPGAYCDHFSGCGGPGACQLLPDACTADCPGVCGCDGTTHCNACDAAALGVDVAYDGPCEATPCEGRSYCDCEASPGCEPLIDLSTGCVCPCDDPFNCTGTVCDCACGGAQYRGCAPAGLCAMTQVGCGPGCVAVPDGAGCLVCACDTPIPG